MKNLKSLFVCLFTAALITFIVNPAAGADVMPIESLRDYSYMYYLNGIRKNLDTDKSPEILCFESGYYGLSIDLADFSKTTFGLFDKPVSFTDSMKMKGSRMRGLPKAELDISITLNRQRYTAKNCLAGTSKKLNYVYLWEVGSVAQFLELKELNFVNAKGEKLGGEHNLEICAWPKSLNFNLNATPAPNYQPGPVPGVAGDGMCFTNNPKKYKYNEKADSEKVTLSFWVNVPKGFQKYQAWNVPLVFNGSNAMVNGAYGVQFANSSYDVCMKFDTPGGLSVIGIPSNNIKNDVWNNIALTYDGKKMVAYVNGNPMGERAVNLPRPKSADKGPIIMCKRADNIGAPFHGMLDEVRIWNRALSAKEIEENYRARGNILHKEGLVFEENFGEGKSRDVPSSWANAIVEMKFKTAQKESYAKKIVYGNWASNLEKKFHLSYNIGESEKAFDDVVISMVGKNGKRMESFPVRFDPKYNSYVGTTPRNFLSTNSPAKSWKDFDEFTVRVENRSGKTKYIPFMFHMLNAPGITGVLPIFCNADGTPNGTPMQLSKNWHDRQLKNYMRSYMIIPAKSGLSKYKIRVFTGFYGSLPQASHANLSLVGWGGNGRWEQLALGAWGESICFDTGMGTPHGHIITDVRGSLVRFGKKGGKWRWTDAGWGGDWLGLYYNHSWDVRYLKRLWSNEVKIGYLNQGPCLTDARLSSYFGENKEVEVSTRIEHARSNDHVRTFQTLNYKFLKTVKAKDAFFYKMGPSADWWYPKAVMGNKEGLLKEMPLKNVDGYQYLLQGQELAGSAPFWIGYPETQSQDITIKRMGLVPLWRSIVIREYEAKIGGKTYTNPTIDIRATALYGKKQDHSTVMTYLRPPKGVTEFKPGDTVKLVVEEVSFPNEVDDYYGENEAFRKHLAANKGSWKTLYREAAGNDLEVTVSNGTLKRNYPVLITDTKPGVKVNIKGGVGYAPITFSGLKKVKGLALYQIINGKNKKLDQSTYKGNNFRQVVYDPATKSYSVTYNIPLNGITKSSWVLQ